MNKLLEVGLSKCSRCGETKPLSAFGKKRSGDPSYDCKACDIERKAYRQALADLRANHLDEFETLLENARAKVR